MKTQLVLGAVALTLLSGCKDMTPGEAATQIGADLGISVQYRTTDEDRCARRQIFGLLNEYADYNAAGKEAVKAAIKAKYKTLVFGATQQTGTSLMMRVYLALYSSGSEINRKVFAEDVKVEGSAPVNHVTKDETQATLSIMPQSMLTRAYGTQFRTSNSWFFNLLETEQAAREAARMADIPVTAYHYDNTETVCGKTLTLAEIL